MNAAAVANVTRALPALSPENLSVRLCPIGAKPTV
jgi:hypothetical protein